MLQYADILNFLNLQNLLRSLWALLIVWSFLGIVSVCIQKKNKDHVAMELAVWHGAPTVATPPCDFHLSPQFLLFYVFPINVGCTYIKYLVIAVLFLCIFL